MLSIIAVALFINATLCGMQYLAQQYDLRAGRIYPRGSIIKESSTRQRYNHWQDAACQTWGDLLGLGLASAVFVESVPTLGLLGWGIFLVSTFTGMWLWYWFITQSNYKPNWQLNKRGEVSTGGWFHVIYFGIQIGVAATTLYVLSSGVSASLAVLCFIGWGVYMLAILVDTVRGYKKQLD